MTYTGAALKEPVQLRDLLQIGLKTRADEPALVSLEGTWSWSGLERRAAALAAAYLALGLVPGDRVASLMPNRLALIAHYLACFKAGLVLTPLNYRYTPREIDHALGVSRAKIMVAHAERGADIAASAARDLPLGVIFYGAKGGAEKSLERLMDAAPPAVALPVVAPEAPAAIFFTSGSTGPAKGVTHTVSSLGWIFASAATSFKFTPDDTVLPGSSCSHVGGFTVTFAALSAGARVAVARAFDHTELGPLMRAARPTFLSMLPAALLHLIREQGTAADDFSSLRLCRSAGDKVPAELQKEFMALTGKPVSEGYGMTEFGLAALNASGNHGKLGSVGLPSPGFTFAIRDDN
ncbi:MAG: AMP-binding protein, partial [Methyloceanibacter sp.]